MANAAYDFALFEDHSAAPARVPSRQPRRQQAEPLSNVVELPQRELERSARRRLHPVRATVAVLSFVVTMAIAVAMVYSQEQLAMLTEQINTATEALAESQSLEIQLNMQAAQKMNSAQVEEYAVTQLGMSKIVGGQVTYVNVASQDKGAVLQNVEGGSALDRALLRIRSLFL